MKVTIKTLKSEQIPTEVAEDITIGQFKKLLEEKNGWEADLQKLVFKAQQLNDADKKLVDYGVKEGDIIILMMQKPKPKPAEPKKEEPKATPAVDVSKPAEPQPAQPAP